MTGLLILLLLLVNLILFSQTSYLFNPIKGFISAVGVPVACGAVVYYLVKPVYDFLVNKKVPKGIAILAVMLGVIFLFIGVVTSFGTDYPKAIARFSVTVTLLLSNYQ